MRYRFVVEVEVQRDQGKFASRDDIIEQLQEAIEGADPGSFTAGDNGEYSTIEWSVNEEPIAKPKGVKK